MKLTLLFFALTIVFSGCKTETIKQPIDSSLNLSKKNESYPEEIYQFESNPVFFCDNLFSLELPEGWYSLDNKIFNQEDTFVAEIVESIPCSAQKNVFSEYNSLYENLESCDEISISGYKTKKYHFKQLVEEEISGYNHEYYYIIAFKSSIIIVHFKPIMFIGIGTQTEQFEAILCSIK